MAIALFPGSPLSATSVRAEPVELVTTDAAAVAKGRRIGGLLGSEVVNDKDETIGTIDDIIVDEKHRLFAVLRVGDFTERSRPLVVVPYDSLKFDEPRERIILPRASRDGLNKLPVFEYRG
jgi:sporulation protein YlmC with PRC-barrel domain